MQDNKPLGRRPRNSLYKNALSLRLSDAERTRLEYICGREQRSMATMARIAIVEMMKNYPAPTPDATGAA